MTTVILAWSFLVIAVIVRQRWVESRRNRLRMLHALALRESRAEPERFTPVLNCKYWMRNLGAAGAPPSAGELDEMAAEEQAVASASVSHRERAAVMQ